MEQVKRRVSPASAEISTLSELLQVRDRLHMTLEKCQLLENDLHMTGPRLRRIAKRIPSLEVAFEPMRLHRKVLDDLAGNIDKAVAPACAVLKVFDAMHDLERSLLDDPQQDLLGYIGLISRLEEAVSFLSHNCPMAIEWLQEMVEFLDNNQVLQDGPMKRISYQLALLQRLESSRDLTKLDGGLHSECLDRLEREFQRILSHEMSPVLSLRGQAVIKTSCTSNRKLAAQTLRNLHLIVQKLAVNGRRQTCLGLYINTRAELVKGSLKSLPLDHLHRKSQVKLDWKNVEMQIGPWTQLIEMVMVSLCDPEYQLCKDVLGKLGYEVWEETFGKIVVAGGILDFLQFGEAAVRSRDEPQKLFKLLDMFETMNNLRGVFGKLFAGPGCKEVHQKTRDLLKMIVQGAHDILLELEKQTENQRGMQPPCDGSLPKVVSFVVSYFKHLVGEFYGPIMTQVLTIRHSWNDSIVENKSSESLLAKAVLTIMNDMVLNIHEWANLLKEKESVLCHLFLCNNFWYLAVNCQAQELKVLLGDTWLREQQQQVEANISMYVKEGWAKVVQHLHIPGVMTLTGSRAAARDLLKSKLRAFNAAFEELYQKHTKWIVLDAELREKMGNKVVKSVVPAYRTYLQSYGPLLEQDGSKSKYVKYTPQSLERTLDSLFQGRSEKHLVGSGKKMSSSAAIAHSTTVSVV